MRSVSSDPTVYEMQAIVERSQRCLTCEASACNSGSPCYEFTPDGVQVCAELPWWQGKPILPETLRAWKQVVTSYQAVPHRPDD